MYYLQSRYYDPSIGRFFCCDIIENTSSTYSVLGAHLYSYCECDPINNSDSEGNISWEKALSIFNTIGKKAKQILDYILASVDVILGINTGIDWKIFSKIAKEIKRSPHKVKQWYNWLKDKVGKPRTKLKVIVTALAWILFFSSIAGSLGSAKSFIKEVVTQVFTKVAEGLSKLLSWLVSKGIKFLSKFVPALGGALGFLLGEAIGRLLDVFFEKKATQIARKFLKKINVYNFKAHDYIIKYFACLA